MLRRNRLFAGRSSFVERLQRCKAERKTPAVWLSLLQISGSLDTKKSGCLYLFSVTSANAEIFTNA
ncbi:hypothetical protein CI610_00001 [invertebrate metagenome]|uniref:Uncharacterized protein n=1 Tax=invertebrate metagenome TaxID=1711999 RepID=A0A2H9TCY5_9ZZZZ